MLTNPIDFSQVDIEPGSSAIVIDPNPTTPTSNFHLRNQEKLRHETAALKQPQISPVKRSKSSKSYGAGFDIDSLEYIMCVWLQSHSVWFNDEVGNKLMTVLIEAGVTAPDSELKLLKEWPDLIQISDAAVTSYMYIYFQTFPLLKRNCRI